MFVLSTYHNMCTEIHDFVTIKFSLTGLMSFNMYVLVKLLETRKENYV